MRQELWEGKIQPAQLSFLAIYSPPLGSTDDTFRDQVLFYYSRADREAKAARNKTRTRARTKRGNDNNDDNDDDDDDNNDLGEGANQREEENEKLRQIGLAQGMVDFARTFSDGEAVDSVETEKSRIVLQELEKGWWVLASIDLTRLPALSSSLSASSPQSGNTRKSQQRPGEQASSAVEYSSREVSPAPLLLKQIQNAHRTFLLHHGPSLNDLYVKLPRDKFCSSLDRYWTRFCKNWDVLLHQNPATDIFGGIKLAAGGELGVGVGEEEWGSGEREVLEHLVRENAGLVDLTVSRFGQAAPPGRDSASDAPSDATLSEASSGLPWLGCGHLPAAADGLLFGGVGAITRSSLRDISHWVEQIYTYGDYAYGVGDNPLRQRRKRRRRPPPAPSPSPPEAEKEASISKSTPVLPHDPRAQIHDRVASFDHASGTSSPQIASYPGIPPPIVTAAEESLNSALSSAATVSAPGSEQRPSTASSSTGSIWGVSNKWKYYLSLGMAGGNDGEDSRSAPSPSSPKRHASFQFPRRSSSSSSKTVLSRPSRASQATATSTARAAAKASAIAKQAEAQTDLGPTQALAEMQLLEPSPDGAHLASKLARQRTLEAKGHFLIGYKGDLDAVVTIQDASDDNDNTNPDIQPETPMSVDVSDPLDAEGARNVLRTLQVELPRPTEPSPSQHGRDSSPDSLDSEVGDGRVWRRLRVLVYVHRPFIYTLLFDDQRCGLLQMPGFYKRIHTHLNPLHKSLLRSTSLAAVSTRIASSHTQPPEPPSINTENPPYQYPHTSPVFDLVFDPRTLTVHTSIPNIPEPGTPAAEGITGLSTSSSGTDGPPPWTRIEALNVHSQILATLQDTQRNEREFERTSKTSRGWWVVWMRLPPSGSGSSAPPEPTSRAHEQHATNRAEDDDGTTLEDCRVAFLVRKASDFVHQRNGSHTRASSGMFGWSGSGSWSGLTSMGTGNREDANASGGAANAGKWGNATSLAGGIGIDARRYVEGLLSLNR